MLICFFFFLSLGGVLILDLEVYIERNEWVWKVHKNREVFYDSSKKRNWIYIKKKGKE
jgi:hypothetical protein